MSRLAPHICKASTEHEKRYLIFSDSVRAVRLEGLIKTLGKVNVSEEDGLSNHICGNCLYRTVISLRDKLSEFRKKCASTQEDLEKGAESVKRCRLSSPGTPVRKRDRVESVEFEPSSNNSRPQSQRPQKSLVSQTPLNKKSEDAFEAHNPSKDPGDDRPLESLPTASRQAAVKSASTNDADGDAESAEILSNTVAHKGHHCIRMLYLTFGVLYLQFACSICSSHVLFSIPRAPFAARVLYLQFACSIFFLRVLLCSRFLLLLARSTG